MNGHGQSDRFVVPANPPNKAAAAEAGEERERAKGNTAGETRPGRSAGPGVSSGVDRVREAARRDEEARGPALLPHVNLHPRGRARAGARGHEEEGEVGAGRGYPRLLGSMVILLLC